MNGKSYIITGTDTDVGKTVFAAGLAGALGAHYWKPVQAGLEEEADSEVVARLTRSNVTVIKEAYRLKTPCSPHEAARIDGCVIEDQALALPRVDGSLIVEGAGGALVPYRNNLLAADLFARWDLPAILVARTTLGTISHSLLSLEVLRSRGLTVAGIAFVGEDEPVAQDAITSIGQVPFLGRLPYIKNIDSQLLGKVFAENFELEKLR